MPQAIQTGEFNTFVGGLVTEASPLTFPENASLDEANFILNRDGSRRRRLGMDREEGLTPYSLSYAVPPVGDLAISAFEWKDVSGIASKSFVVCQVHNKMYIMDRADSSLQSSSYVKASFDLRLVQTPDRASFASIDGKLVVAYGGTTVKVITYTQGSDSLSEEDLNLKVRDLFGVEDIISGRDLLSPEYVNLRPTSTALEENHMYNLRNQGWAIPRLDWTGDLKVDPVSSFEDSGGDERGLPSNADTPVSTFYANTSETDANSERFNDEAAYRQEPARSRAAVGHFIIDLLDRGASRKAQYEQVTNTTTGTYINANPGATPESITFRTPTVTLPVDRTDGGIGVVAEFAGRVWYGGFSSQIQEGDSQSPNLASYVFYSQLVEQDAQIARCYQEGDPTDVQSPDRLDTDGGFIRLSGAFNVQAMVNIGTGLMVLAENGVWFVSGSDNGTFSANNQTVTKITEHGTLSPGSVVLVDSSIMYWAEDAIYHIRQNQYGTYEAAELSVNIRDYYQDISDESKVLAQGIYDSYEKRVRWVWDNTTATDTTKELVFDVVLSAFFPSVIGNLETSQIPVAPIQISPFSIGLVETAVVVGEDEVFSDTDPVVMGSELPVGGFRETAYLTLVNSDNIISASLTFSTYSNSNFKDWESVDATGVDASAYLLTGYISTGDYHRFKQVPYVYFHFLRTESGFTDDTDDFIVLNESSCKVRSQWDWANSTASGKWGKEFQAYRYRRMYFPEDADDSYDSGHRTIVSKNKLRGRGRVVSLLLSSEEGKDLNLLGWSMNIASNQSV